MAAGVVTASRVATATSGGPRTFAAARCHRRCAAPDAAEPSRTVRSGRATPDRQGEAFPCLAFGLRFGTGLSTRPVAWARLRGGAPAKGPAPARKIALAARRAVGPPAAAGPDATASRGVLAAAGGRSRVVVSGRSRTGRSRTGPGRTGPGRVVPRPGPGGRPVVLARPAGVRGGTAPGPLARPRAVAVPHWQVTGGCPVGDGFAGQVRGGAAAPAGRGGLLRHRRARVGRVAGISVAAG